MTQGRRWKKLIQLSPSFLFHHISLGYAMHYSTSLICCPTPTLALEHCLLVLEILDKHSVLTTQYTMPDQSFLLLINIHNMNFIFRFRIFIWFYLQVDEGWLLVVVLTNYLIRGKLGTELHGLQHCLVLWLHDIILLYSVSLSFFTTKCKNQQRIESRTVLGLYVPLSLSLSKQNNRS